MKAGLTNQREKAAGCSGTTATVVCVGARLTRQPIPLSVFKRERAATKAARHHVGRR